MKVAILSFYSGRWSRGVETWAFNLKFHLQDKIEVDIISGWKSYIPCYWLTADIIVPANGRMQAPIARIFCWITGKPMVIFGNSGPGADDKWNLICSPNVFVASASYQAKWAERFKFPWTKVCIIHHAVDTQKFSPPAKRFKNNVVLCVAADSPAKRIGLVRDAVQLLPGVKFVHIGGDPKEAKYNDLPDAYRRANVFCLVMVPWQAFGLVFLEAMATNLPVVTTDDPIRREIVGKAGILVKNPENPKQLSQAIKKTLETDWGELPLKQVEKFSWDAVVPKYIEMFESL